MATDRYAMRSLIAIQLISMGAMEMSGPFWPLQIQALLRPEHAHYSGWLSALVYAGPMMAAIIFTPMWGRLGDRVGHKWMIIRALLALAICQVLAGLLLDPWALVGIRVIQGAMAGFIAAAQAYALRIDSLNAQPAPGQALSRLQSATAIGSLAGPVMGGRLIEAQGFDILCYCAAALCLACALIVLSLPDVPRQSRTRPSNTTHAHSLPKNWLATMLLIIVLIQAAKAMPQPFYALYVTEVLKATPTLIGASYAASAVTLALSAPLWGRLFDRSQPLAVLQVIEWVTWACAATLAISAIANDWTTFITSRLVWGVWQGALLPVAYALIANTLPTDSHGFALGVGNSAAKAGALVGALIGGVGMSIVGIAHSFWMVALSYAIAAMAIRIIRSHSHSLAGASTLCCATTKKDNDD